MVYYDELLHGVFPPSNPGQNPSQTSCQNVVVNINLKYQFTDFVTVSEVDVAYRIEAFTRGVAGSSIINGARILLRSVVA